MNNEEKILALLQQMQKDNTARFDGLEARQGRTEALLEKLDERIDALEQGQSRLEDQVAAMQDDVTFTKNTALKIEVEHGQLLRALSDGQTVLESRVDKHDIQLRKLAR